MNETQRRKDEHLRLLAGDAPGGGGVGTLLDEVFLYPAGLADLDWSELDTTTELFGKTLQAPLLIGAMTGGTKWAGELNRRLAAVAGRLGIGMCLGSQRAMIEEPGCVGSFQVRSALGPEGLLIGNIGIAEVRRLGPGPIGGAVEAVDADALAVHLNIAQELIQPEGERDFRGCFAALEELVEELEVPVLVKEVGAGIDRRLARRLQGIGVAAVELAGAGGTSFVALEARRAEGRKARLGPVFAGWGLPTAACLLRTADLSIPRIASGGVRTGLDVARCLALGAQAAAMARPVLQAMHAGGEEAATELLSDVVEGLRTTMMLTGAASVTELRSRPRSIGQRLRHLGTLAK